MFNVPAGKKVEENFRKVKQRFPSLWVTCLIQLIAVSFLFLPE
jgi:hypothetical protein